MTDQQILDYEDTKCDSEAFSAFNTLVGYCVGKGMDIKKYKTTDDILYNMRGPIRQLHSIIKIKS